MGGFTGLFDRPDPQTAMLVKNPDLQAYIDQAIAGYGGYRNRGQAALDDFIKKYQANTAASEQATGQETGAIDQFYNGNMASRLADLRTRRAGAVNAAADVATKQAMRGLNSNRVAGQGSGSSYAQRVAQGALVPIRTQAALDQANSERSDLDYLTGNQINLAGARNRLRDAQSGRALVPWQTEGAMNASNTGYLSGLIGQDQANKFYGIKQQPGLLDRMQQEVQFLQGLQSIMKNQYGTASEAYGGWAGGGMGGGGGGGGGGMGGMGSMMGGMGGMKRGGLVRVQGAKVKRGDYRKGGAVDGPGSGTSDSIPARLSDGEFVVPAAAVRLPGVLAMLLKIRDLGMKAEAGEPHLAYGGLLYADSWGGLGSQNLARDQFNEATMAGQVAQIQEAREAQANRNVTMRGQDQRRDEQQGEAYRDFVRYYGMPKGSRGGGGGAGGYGPGYNEAGYPVQGGGSGYGYGGEEGFASGGMVQAELGHGYAEGGAVGGAPGYESASTKMWRLLAERRAAELEGSGEVPMSPGALQQAQLNLQKRQLDLDERRVRVQEEGGSPQALRDREFQERQLSDLGANGGIESLEHARRLAPEASETARQLAYEQSAAVRQQHEQLYRNASKSADLLNAYDRAMELKGDATEPVKAPRWSDNPEKAAQRQTVNSALALTKKYGPVANKLRQSQMVVLDPASNSWVPAVGRPRWLKMEGEAGGDYSQGASGSGPRQTTMSVPSATVPGTTPATGAATRGATAPAATGRRYSAWVYDRVRDLSGKGIAPVEALGQALKEEQALFQ